MAVLPQFGGLAEAQMRALVRNSRVQLLFAAGNNGYQQYNNCAGVVSGGAQSELTCNGGCGGVVLPLRKRWREAGIEQFVLSSSSALLPVPGMLKEVNLSLPEADMASRTVDPVMMASTSGRAVESSAQDALVLSELCRQGAEIDALVRAECDRLRAGLEQAWKRQCQALARAVAGAAERRLRVKEAELQAARRSAADLEERLRQAAAESTAWCGLARSHEAVAAGLRATLDHLLLRGVAATATAEGFGESDPAPSAVAADDAQSCCFEVVDTPLDTAAAGTSAAGKWACKACGEREASVLLLPCRHLCLCKVCEPRTDACPVCLVAKTASVNVAEN